MTESAAALQHKGESKRWAPKHRGLLQRGGFAECFCLRTHACDKMARHLCIIVWTIHYQSAYCLSLRVYMIKTTSFPPFVPYPPIQSLD